jgi:hypothetical protein
MTEQSTPGYKGLAPKPELLERLTTTRLSPEAIAKVTHEVFESYDLPNGKVLHIEQRHDQKDGFVNDDKRNKAREEATGVVEEAQFYIATPADLDKAKGEAVKERVVYKHTPDWRDEADAKAPRDVLHPFVGCLVMQTRKAWRDREAGFLVAQVAEERVDKRPSTEAVLALTLAQASGETIEPQVYDELLTDFAGYFDGTTPAEIKETFDKLTAKSVEYVQALAA